jgi:hypothetical protein
MLYASVEEKVRELGGVRLSGVYFKPYHIECFDAN